MNVMRTGLLLAALTALFLVVGGMLGGEQGMVLAFVVAIAMNAFAYWNSDKMVLRMHGARVVTRATAPDLYRMVEELAGRAQLPTPAVYVIDSDQPNAFATGRDPQHAAVAVTTGIMAALSREQLAGVVAHELAHIKNRDTLIMTVAATIAGAIGMLANFGFMLGRSRDGERPSPIVGILVMILAPMAAMLVQMAISRTREFSADRLGAEICGDPASLAGALEQIERFAQGTHIASADANPATAHLFIVNPLHGGAIAGLFRTHPPTAQRIAALMAMGRPSTGGTPRRAAPSQARRPQGTPTRRAGSVPDAGSSRGSGRSPWQR